MNGSNASSDDLLEVRSEVSEGNESEEDWSEEDGSESSYMVDRDNSSESEVRLPGWKRARLD